MKIGARPRATAAVAFFHPHGINATGSTAIVYRDPIFGGSKMAECPCVCCRAKQVVPSHEALWTRKMRQAYAGAATSSTVRHQLQSIFAPSTTSSSAYGGDFLSEVTTRQREAIGKGWTSQSKAQGEGDGKAGRSEFRRTSAASNHVFLRKRAAIQRQHVVHPSRPQIRCSIAPCAFPSNHGPAPMSKGHLHGTSTRPCAVSVDIFCCSDPKEPF